MAAPRGPRPEQFEASPQGLEQWLGEVAIRCTKISRTNAIDYTHEFVPESKVREFLGDIARTRRLLASFRGPHDEAQTVAESCSRTLCILVELRREEQIENFVKNEALWDKHLPHPSKPRGFPRVAKDPDFWEDFEKAQWKYCPFTLETRKSLNIEKEYILPILQKRWLAGGFTSDLHHIIVHKEYDGLIPSDEERHEDREFALKTYRVKHADATYYYEKETENFAQLMFYRSEPTPGLIAFYGGFVHNGTHNLLLEYADYGTLEDYFESEEPPSSGADILTFWKNLAEIIKGLVKIHNIGRDPLDKKGRFVLKGWHQDIKPKNVLVLGQDEESPYQRRFKLADLGLSHFDRFNPEDMNAVGTDTMGTRTYGAPEIHRRSDTDEMLDYQATNQIDIWSLGCVIIEACVWVIRGRKYLHAFKTSRTLANDRLQPSANDCFHNGRQPRPALLMTVQEQIDQLIYERRSSDFITIPMLKHATIMVRSDPRARPSAYVVQADVTNSLDDAEKMLARHNAGRPYYCEADLALRPSLSAPQVGTPQSPPVTPPNMSAHRQMTGKSAVTFAEPDSEGFLGDGYHSSPRSSGFFDGSPPQNLQPGRSATVSAPPSTQQMFRQPPQAPIPQRVPSARTAYSTSKFRPLREDAGEEQPIGNATPIQPIRSSTAETAITTRTTAEPRFPERVMKPIPPFDNDFHEPLRPESSRSRDISSLSPPVDTPQINPQQTLSETVGNPSEPSRQANMSLADALSYIQASSSGFKRFVKPPKLADGHYKDWLKSRDHVFLIDDSVTMRDWAERVQQIFYVLGYFAIDADPNGIDIKFTNAGETRTISKHKELKGVVDFVKTRISSAQQGTNIQIRLRSILSTYVAKLQDQRHRAVLPLSVYILTDGKWTRGNDAESLIIQTARELKNLKQRRNQVGLQFIQFGPDDAALGRLQRIDDIGKSRDLEMDVVDTTDHQGNIWKMLLGAIDPLFDDT